jgi:cytochrome b pre-mRNA-processing protein 3
MPIWPFQRSRADEDAARLLAQVQAASRRPAFFGAERIPDTLEGRFEFLALNGALALIRLKAAPETKPLAQAFTDQLFRLVDAGLREAGVGDTTVPKRMRKLAADFYGRLGAYAPAIEASHSTGLEAALARNVWGAEKHPFAPTLAAHVLALARCQADNPWDALFAEIGWQAPAV